MSQTTFSGPILAGTIKSTTGTTVGTNVKNTGQVVMAQSFTTGVDLDGGASAANTTTVIIPANSQIIDIVLDVVGVMVGRQVQVKTTTGSPRLTITDGNGGAVALDMDLNASVTHSANIPSDGIRVSDIWVSAVTAITSVTVFYS